MGKGWEILSYVCVWQIMLSITLYSMYKSCTFFQICHSGDINPVKIQGLIDAYVAKYIKANSKKDGDPKTGGASAGKT